jgi:antitoxin ParD1/3/4
MAERTAVSLTREQKTFVDRLVRSGRFDGASEVVSTGLRLLEEREREAARFVAALEDEIEKGLESGDAVEMESAETLSAAFRRER